MQLRSLLKFSRNISSLKCLKDCATTCRGLQSQKESYYTSSCRLREMWKLGKVVKSITFLKDSSQTVDKNFQKTVTKFSDKVAFIFEDKQWTFKEVDAYSNKVANYFQSIGYKKGDVVALFMENRPEFVFFWLGLSKIGVISALVNCNLKKEPLQHCISITNSKGLIYSTDPKMADAVGDIHSRIQDIQLFEFGAPSTNGLETVNIEEKIEHCSKVAPIPDSEIQSEDPLFYIYTSGTTGYPKACFIKHKRFLLIAVVLQTRIYHREEDVLYNALPMYHTQSGIVGVGSTLIGGSTMICCRKFSTSRFWEDCVKYKATWFMYVGEVCRYLLAQAPKEIERAHSLRFIYGNGLRRQIWQKFQARFNIPAIYELYGATEGNVNFINTCGYPGAVGHLFVCLPSRWHPSQLFKIDMETGELLRGPNGRCVPCKRGEVGQMLGKIMQGLSQNFDGYVNKQATEKKIARDVLQKGDQWFLTGDTFFCDELGYLFFHDRIGDTFRWRGENVSTTEVEGIIIKVLGLNSVVVFGVEVPGCEGRAGMAVIEDPDDVINIPSLGKRLLESLPSYACPVFIRVTHSVDTTGTFKFQKTRFCKEGFDTSIVSDKLFYLDQKSGEYRVLSEEIHQKFQNDEMHM